MMRRTLSLLLLSATLLLAGCELVVSGGPTWPDDLTITNAGYLTDARASIDGVERYVICDDRVSDLTYYFDYHGTLESWSSYLRGVTTGDVIGYRTFYPGSSGVTHSPNDVTVTYAIQAGVAPLNADDAVTPRGIVVVPVPQVIGYTNLYLKIASSSAELRLVSREIPVVANCLG